MHGRLHDQRQQRPARNIARQWTSPWSAASAAAGTAPRAALPCSRCLRNNDCGLRGTLGCEACAGPCHCLSLPTCPRAAPALPRVNVGRSCVSPLALPELPEGNAHCSETRRLKIRTVTALQSLNVRKIRTHLKPFLALCQSALSDGAPSSQAPFSEPALLEPRWL